MNTYYAFNSLLTLISGAGITMAALAKKSPTILEEEDPGAKIYSKNRKICGSDYISRFYLSQSSRINSIQTP